MRGSGMCTAKDACDPIDLHTLHPTCMSFRLSWFTEMPSSLLTRKSVTQEQLLPLRLSEVQYSPSKDTIRPLKPARTTSSRGSTEAPRFRD